jgi:hypothetical protein
MKFFSERLSRVVNVARLGEVAGLLAVIVDVKRQKVANIARSHLYNIHNLYNLFNYN